jgi:hypothetical protein
MKNAIDFFGRKGTLFFCAIACVTALAVVGLAGCEDGSDDDPKPSGGGDVDVSWTEVDSSPFGSNYTDTINAIAYGNNVFVAAGTGGEVATSPDGNQWTGVTTDAFGEDDVITGIAYGGVSEAKLFVAVSFDGKIATSEDGDTWTVVDNATTFGADKYINGIACGSVSGSDLFVVVGEYYSGGGKAQIATSADGAEWSAVTDDAIFTKFSISDIAYGNGMFVAVGSDTENSGKGKIATSTNGTTWVAVTDCKFGEDFDKINGIAGSGSVFVAVGAKGKMATSPDGAEWSAVGSTTFYVNNGINCIAYGNGTFVAGGAEGDKMATSPNGTAWTAVDPNKCGDLSEIRDIAYGNGTFVAAGRFGKIAYWDGK